MRMVKTMQKANLIIQLGKLYNDAAACKTDAGACWIYYDNANTRLLHKMA